MIMFKNLSKKQRFIFGMVAGVAILSGIWMVLLQFTSTDSNSIVLTAEEIEQRVVQQKRFHDQKNNAIEESALWESARQDLVEQKIIERYAQKNGISVTNDQILSYYETRLKSEGGSEAKLLQELSDLYGIDKSEYFENIRYSLLREAVQERLKQDLLSWLRQQKQLYKVVLDT